MGFYGNISNAGKTQISFDRIYANRRQMEEFCSSDNIFIGRKILIEYDDNTYPRRQGYIKSEDINKDGLVQLYLDTELINPYREAKSDKEVGYGFKEYDIVMVHYEDYYYYYVCEKFDKEGIAQFSLVKADSEKQTDYTINFLIDREWAKNNGIDFANGWDSTVWEKIFINDEFKYVNIAELNSKLPKFDIRPYAPSEKPKVPKFDEIGTNLDYYINEQATWGFRVKPAEKGGLSDVKTIIDGEQCDADIYFNAQALKTDNDSVKTRTLAPKNMENIIDLEEAASGNTYYLKDGNTETSKELADIKELKINLPGIGDVVARLWDLLYGEYDNNGIKEERNLDIEWDSKNGARMFELADDGYKFNQNNGKSVAGCINSIHDLMGMIIVSDVNDVEIADTDKIYYGNLVEKNEKGYYIKEKTYEYDPIEDEKELEDYIKSIEPVELTQFEANKYYTKNNNGYALVTTSQYKEGTNYYTLGIEDIDLDGTYAPDKYFYLDGPTLNYVKDLEELPNENIQYYDIEFTPLENKFYHPGPHIENEDGTFTGLFYEDEVNERIEIIDGEDDPVFNPDGKYFIGKNYTFEEKYDKSQNKVIVYEFAEKEYIELVEFKYDENDKVNNYYSIDENGNYICLTNINDIDDSIEYGKITLIEKKKFYEPNLYYYKSGNDFIFSKDKFDENASYVILTDTDEPIKNTFYEPNKYYYKDKDNFAIDKLDTNENMTPDREYFLKYFAYIYEDTRGVLDEGAEWNGNVKKIPEEITLAKRTEKYEWKKLEGFARTLNTIHGLIIKINNLLKLDDYKTRDNRTVQGCINVLNDIINTFATLIPGQIAIVDEYGRLASAPYETDKWINLQVDDDVIDHKITVTHSDPVPLQNPLEKKDLTLSFGDLFTIPEWAFDDKGHKTDSITHEIKIPEWNLEDVEHNNADIITNLSFTPTSGKLKTTRKNIVDLVLTNYELGNNNSNIVDTDTIGQAFGKTQNKINEIAAWISDEDAGAAKMKADINIINEKLTDEKITKWDQAEQNVQSDWLVEDESADNFIKNKPDLTNLVKTDTQFNYTFGDVTIQMTIEGLLNYIASLEARIYNLENPIEEEVPPVE